MHLLGRLPGQFFPGHIVVPVLNWPFLDCFRVMCMDVGDVRLSKATSNNSRSVEESM